MIAWRETMGTGNDQHSLGVNMKSLSYTFTRTTMCGVAALALVLTQANGTLLTDGNSQVNVEAASQSGMNSWVVDGIDHLNTQWFWYRDGGMTQEQSLDTLAAPVLSSTANSLSATYTGADYEIVVEYLLTGGAAGSGSSTINEDITINNLSGSPLTLSFFQYSDFNLAGTAGGDEVLLVPPSGPPFVRAQQWEDITAGLMEVITDKELTAVTPADHGEAAFAFSTLGKLTDGFSDTLNDNVSAGEGDVTFAFQWDYNALIGNEIAAGGSTTISKIKALDVMPIPEPGTAAVFLMGLGLMAGRRLRRSQA